MAVVKKVKSVRTKSVGCKNPKKRRVNPLLVDIKNAESVRIQKDNILVTRNVTKHYPKTTKNVELVKRMRAK